MKPLLVVSPSAKAGGAERALASLVRQLPAFGFRPLVALTERGPLERWLAEGGCEVVPVPHSGSGELTRTLQSLARVIGAEIVLSNKWEGHLLGGPVAAAAGVPAVWWQHDVARINAEERRAATLPAEAVVCCSDYAARAQEKLAPRARIVAIHSGAPVARVAAHGGRGAAIRHALGWDLNPVVGIVGRLERWKRQDVLLRAAQLLGPRHPDVRYAVIGGAILGTEGAYPDELRRLAAELELGDSVHFAGHQNDVYPWFDALDIAVHTSRGEPFGLVLVEAMALGKPLVATIPGAPAEIVEDGKSGLLAPFGEPGPLAEAIGKILEDTELAARLGREARLRARLFSEERMAERFSELFRELLGARRKSLV